MDPRDRPSTMSQLPRPRPTGSPFPSTPPSHQPHRFDPPSVHRAYGIAPPAIHFPSSAPSSTLPHPHLGGASTPSLPDLQRHSSASPRRTRRPNHQKRASPASSVSSSVNRTSRPGRCPLPRASDHATYETFPIPPPRTPWEERELPSAIGDFLPRSVGVLLPVGMRSREERRVLGFGKDEEAGREQRRVGRGEAEWLLPDEAARPRVVRDSEVEGRVGAPPEVQMEGVPKLTRECFWAELKCYGSYILPVILGFGLLTVIIILSIYSGRL